MASGYTTGAGKVGARQTPNPLRPMSASEHCPREYPKGKKGKPAKKGGK